MIVGDREVDISSKATYTGPIAGLMHNYRLCMYEVVPSIYTIPVGKLPVPYIVFRGCNVACLSYR